MTPRRARRSAAKRPVPPPARTRFRLAPWQVAVLLAGLHLALAVLSYVPMPFAGGDNGTYLSLARSLLEGTGYRDVWDPVARPHTQYPPLFPLLLAAAMKLGLTTEPALKSVVVLASVAAVAFSYLWARRVTTPGVALAVGLFLAVSPGVLDHTHWVLSDVPFWTFAMLALWAFAHRVPEPAAKGGEAPPAGGAGWLALAVAGVLLAHFTRAAGLPLVVACGAFLLLRRRWRDAAVLAAVLVPAIAAWGLYARAVNAPGYLEAFRYIDPYDTARGTLTVAHFFRRLEENASAYVGNHIPTTLFFDAPPLSFFVGTLFTALAVAGWVMRARRGPGLAELWVPLHAGLILIWPEAWSGTRFVLPILPVMLVYAVEPLRWLGERAGDTRRALVPAAVLLTMLTAPSVVGKVAYGQRCTSASNERGSWLTCLLPMWESYFGVAEQVRGRLPADAVVLSRKPTLFYVVSGYRSSLYPLTERRDSIFAYADSVGAEWVVVDRVPDLAPRFLHPVLFRYSEEFCLVSDAVHPEAFLLRIDRERTKGTGEPGPSGMRECPFDSRWLPPGMTIPGTSPAGNPLTAPGTTPEGDQPPDSVRLEGPGPGT